MPGPAKPLIASPALPSRGREHLPFGRIDMLRKPSIAFAVAAMTFAAITYADEQEHKGRLMLRASPAIGLPVIGAEGESLGQIHEMVICPEGDRISYVVVSTGGILGIGAALHPIPIEALAIYYRGVHKAVHPRWTAEIDISPERFRDGPTLEEDDWTKLADAEWTEQVDNFYKVEPVAERGNRQVYRASNLIGLPVRDKQGETTLGNLYDIAFERYTGRIRYGALSFGGFLGIGDELFAIPWQSMTPTRPEEDEPFESLTLAVDVDENKLREADGFARDAWPRTADERFLATDAAQP